ncbi:MAG: amidoligase family protein [Candidatus Azobacteroides sp.]|nr:amidoligase family protein [Candidatus Azobacteroides sp.]
MKTLNEQIKEVMTSKKSANAKAKDLVELGLKKTEINRLLDIYKPDDAIPFTLGVEIECFNVDKNFFLAYCKESGIKIEEERYNHDTKNHYKIVSDSSIQGENAVECVSPVLKGKTGLNSLKKVCKALNESGASVNRSTGLHVHTGLQNISFEQYKNIFINYIYLESAIDKFMAKSRRGNDNVYCKSVNLENVTIHTVSESGEYSDIAYIFRHDRYFKLNPVSYERHNTLEFRQHGGTTDYDKIEMWVRFIVKLVKWSKNNRLESKIENIPDIPFLNESEKEYFINRAAALE